MMWKIMKRNQIKNLFDVIHHIIQNALEFSQKQLMGVSAIINFTSY
ncbi:unnamed protein product [Schistosoma curassoni]|uniref:ATP-binding protein n=1 Tax=Schistosoma curassoni TaxID=6186 RepID=A0A183JRB5_9TREM|nr:unnamed protein product [Schistosoma curassoni]